MKLSARLLAAAALVLLLATGCQIVNPTPPAPKPLAPVNGSHVYTITPLCQVEAIKDADQYQWTVYDETKAVVAQVTTPGASWTIPKGKLVNDKVYLWTCQAHNTHGWGKNFAPEWKFETEVALPAAPSAREPGDGSEVATLTPSLEVQAISDADEYQWFVKDTNGRDIVRGNTPEKYWTVPAGTLTDKQKYSWSCQVRNAAGWGPLMAPEWTFRVKLPPPPKPPAPPLATIHFDFDKYDIRAGDAGILTDNASWLKANLGVSVQLQGFCDPIGTEEYNRGLGLRRANAARAYLAKLGIDVDRLPVISFGKEKLVTNDEAQYELNRRVEFVQK
jgi:outer membrane protein OmpA-like peptidoglycan-associated protein